MVALVILNTASLTGVEKVTWKYKVSHFKANILANLLLLFDNPST